MKLPILISVPHAGTEMPLELSSHANIKTEDVIKDGDEQAAAIYRMMAEGYTKLGRKDYADKAETFAKQVEAMAPPPTPIITKALPLRERDHERVARAELLLEAPAEGHAHHRKFAAPGRDRHGDRSQRQSVPAIRFRRARYSARQNGGGGRGDNVFRGNQFAARVDERPLLRGLQCGRSHRQPSAGHGDGRQALVSVGRTDA